MHGVATHRTARHATDMGSEIMETWERELLEAAGHDPDDAAVRNAARDAARMTDLIHTLRGFRERAKLTQQEIADRMGTTQSRVSNFERLGADPRLSTVFRYARAVDSHLRWTCPVPTVRVTIADDAKPSVAHVGIPSDWTGVSLRKSA